MNDSDIRTKPVIHPGLIFEKFLLNKRDPQEVAKASDIPVHDLQQFAAGRTAMTEDFRKKLEPLFGEAANNLFRIQASYDYFQEHGKRPARTLEP